MTIPEIYYDETKDEWFVIHNKSESGAICSGDYNGSSGCTGSLSCGNIGVFGGRNNSYIIDYITISTPGNAQDFGDLTIARFDLGATSNA